MEPRRARDARRGVRGAVPRAPGPVRGAWAGVHAPQRAGLGAVAQVCHLERGSLMRIRNIKPEFWRSVDVKSLSPEDRLLFIGLWSYVDDNGVGVDDHRQIAADLFPLEDDPL